MFINENRIRQAASSLGTAVYCIQESVAYAKSRKLSAVTVGLVTTTDSLVVSASLSPRIKPFNGLWSNTTPKQKCFACSSERRQQQWTPCHRPKSVPSYPTAFRCVGSHSFEHLRLSHLQAITGQIDWLARLQTSQFRCSEVKAIRAISPLSTSTDTTEDIG
jgi:hypothetical protein